MGRKKKSLTDAFNQFTETDKGKEKDNNNNETNNETEKVIPINETVKENEISNSNSNNEQKDESVKSNNESEQNNVTEESNNESITSDVIQNSNKTVESVKQSLLNKYEEKANRETVEETHTRATFLFRNDLSSRLDKLAKKKKRGFKTLFINDAIEALLDEMEK